MEERDFMEEIDPSLGLTDEQVQSRTPAGKPVYSGKSEKEIVLTHCFTFFNLIFVILAVMLIVGGSSPLNMGFLVVAVINTVIGIIQEIRAKRAVERLTLVAERPVTVIRSGARQEISPEAIVKDDIAEFASGDTLPADGILRSGEMWVDESLLTGEADAVTKTPGDEVKSGSAILSGRGRVQFTAVGGDSFAAQLSREAQKNPGAKKSEMMRSLDRLILFVGIALVPVGIILFYQEFCVLKLGLESSVEGTVAALVGMIPEGLYLLTSIAMAASAVKLSRKKVLVQDMNCIETLARVDVLCVDKTGTITEPGMCVREVHAVQSAKTDEFTDETLANLLTDYCLAAQDTNETMQALRVFSEAHRLAHPQQAAIALDVQPFSSSQKYSSVTFETGTYLLGAPEFVLKTTYAAVASELKPYLDKGMRVLLLATSRGQDAPEPLGYAVLTGRIRENAKETFAYFKDQDVTVKVISGDNARAVSEIARQAGIENAETFIDATCLITDEQIARAAESYTVFGRVTPAQKQKLVRAMQAAGHTVAMTGDGVNDILAMKDADCSVAMASGSEAAAQAAQVVLLDSDFARMPDVVLEGRRVVNNIERSASLFLVKNLFSLLLSVFSAVSFITYPLEPAQVSLIAMFTIGIPGFLLALEPNHARIEGSFLKKVLLRALPAALTDVLAVGALVVCGEVFGLSDGDIATAATMLLAVVGFMILIRISKPLTKMKYAIIILNIAGLIFCGIFLKQLFALNDMSKICVLLMVVFAFAAESIFRNLSMLGAFLERKTGALREKLKQRRNA